MEAPSGPSRKADWRIALQSNDRRSLLQLFLGRLLLSRAFRRFTREQHPKSDTLDLTITIAVLVSSGCSPLAHRNLAPAVVAN